MVDRSRCLCGDAQRDGQDSLECSVVAKGGSASWGDVLHSGCEPQPDFLPRGWKGLSVQLGVYELSLHFHMAGKSIFMMKMLQGLRISHRFEVKSLEGMS